VGPEVDVADRVSVRRVKLVSGDMFDPATLPSPLKLAEARVAELRKQAVINPLVARRKVCAHTEPAYGYVLRDIVHDWPDEDTVRILASLRKGAYLTT